MSLTDDHHFPNLASARRSILHAMAVGQEADLYEGLDRVLQLLSNVADCDYLGTIAYYCAPQGHVTVRGTVKRRDLDELYDRDYQPSPHASDSEEEDFADEDAGNGDTPDDRGDEQEVGPGVGGYGRALRPRRGRNNAQVSHSVARSVSTSTSSSEEVPYKLSRLPDFRLSHAWLKDDDVEVVRYKSALVEVKLCNENTIISSKFPYSRLIDDAIAAMAPQVLEAVQVAFAENPDQKEIVAIPLVNTHCRFVYFTKLGPLPGLDHAMASEGKGFQDPNIEEGEALYDKYAMKSSATICILSMGKWG